jgi:hypothetical protein
MSGQYGTKELQEAIIGVMALVKEIKALTADGAQLSDLPALLAKYEGDADFKAKIDSAIADISNAKFEVSEIDLQDGVDLLLCLLQALK